MPGHFDGELTFEKKKSHVLFTTGSNDTRGSQATVIGCESINKCTCAPNVVSGSPRLAVCGFVLNVLLF